jgi:hypothetical protein
MFQNFHIITFSNHTESTDKKESILSSNAYKNVYSKSHWKSYLVINFVCEIQIKCKKNRQTNKSEQKKNNEDQRISVFSHNANYTVRLNR